ncbi:MAG TPA: PAS domain S-box protein, partial [Cyclobacteriaceae bacterium]|nr:PAS domain S-box protein [Cyclobacteriaceae bacterium]
KGKDLIQYLDTNGKGRSVNFDWMVQAKDGKAVECELHIFPLLEHHIIFMSQPTEVGNWVKDLENVSSHDRQSSSQAMVLFRMSNERNQFYYFSKQWLKFTGKKLKDELNEGWIHHVHPSDHDRVVASINESFKKLVKYEISYRLLRFDGEPRLIFESGIPLFDADGNFIGYLSVSVDFTSVKDIEKDVIFSDNTFKALAENAPVLFKMADEHGHFYYFSKQWIAFSGRHLKDEIRDGWLKYIHKEDYKTMVETLEQAFATKRKYEVVYRISNKEEEYRWLMDIGIPIFNHMGSFTGYISASIDITENKLMEERKSRQSAFRESEMKLQSSLDNSNLIALSVNQEGKIVYCNRYFLELAGLDFSEVIGNDFYRFFEISSLTNTGNISLERYFSDPGYSSGFEAYTKSSFREKFIIRFSSVIFFGDIDQPAAFTLVGENITERIKVREALEQSNAQLKDFLDNANDLIQIFAPDGRLLFVNKIWKLKLGYSDDEIPTLRIQSVVHPDFRPETARILSEMAAGKGTPFLETEFVSKSGQRIHLAGSVNCSFKDGVIKEYRAILYDITDRVRAEKAQNLYHKIANLTIQSSDLDSLFRSIHAELDKIMFAKNFYVALLDSSGTRLTYPYIVDENLGPDPFNFQRELSNGISEFIVLTKKSHHFMESDLEQMELNRTITMTGKIPRTCLGAPLKLHERIIGVLCVQNYTNPDIYSARDLEILEFLSGQIALSIERKRNESKIREQAARQQAIFESTNHLIWSVNRSYKITSSNSNYDQFIAEFIPARSRDEKIQHHDLKFFDPDFWKSKYDVAFNGKSIQFESKFIHPGDNTNVWKDIVLHPIINDSGKVEEISCIAHDITEKKRSEFALRESEEKFRDIFESFQDLYFRCDFKGNILMLSPSVREVLGYDPGEMTGKNITNFYLYTKKTKDLLRQLTRRKSVRNFEASVIAKNGSIMQCICNIRLVYDNNFKAVAMEGVARDITQIKQTHKELKQAKDLAEKSLKVKESFLANMSHEIRTPMNGIIGMIDLLEGTVITGKQKNYIQTIKKSSETLLNILNDILDLSKIEAGKMQLRKHPVRLKNLLEKLVALFSHQANSRNIQLKYFISGKLPEYLMIDETRLLQILSNLTSNAIKFTEGGGSIDISLKKTKVPGKKNMIRCSVSDSGIGISPENLKKLFTSFSQLDTSTTKTFSGTGLGLAISKQLCKLMGGRISVYSTLGLGSTFWFTFQAEPAKRTIVVDNQLFDNDIQIDGYFEREQPLILLVDDNMVNRQVAGEILKKAGCRIDLAESGSEALGLVKKKKYDLIFMDIQMPDMDGVTATKKIKALKSGSQPPVVAMTAYSMKEDKEKFISQGLDDYIAKPIRAVELVNKVRQWIRDDKIPLIEADHITRSETINFGIINQLGNMGGEEMIENVLSEFISESSDQLKNCMESMDNRDYEGILKHLHTLKGNSGTLGIDKLSSIAATIELKLSNKRYETLEDDLNYLNLAFGEFIAEYHELLKSKKNAAI